MIMMVILSLWSWCSSPHYDHDSHSLNMVKVILPILQETLKLLVKILKSPGCRKVGVSSCPHSNFVSRCRWWWRPRMTSCSQLPTLCPRDSVLFSRFIIYFKIIFFIYLCMFSPSFIFFISYLHLCSSWSKCSPSPQVSNVTGENMEFLKMFLNLLSTRSPNTNAEPAEFQVIKKKLAHPLPFICKVKRPFHIYFCAQIDDTYSVPGVGTVVSGTTLRGTIRWIVFVCVLEWYCVFTLVVFVCTLVIFRDSYLAKILAKVRGDFEGFLRQNKLFQCGAAVLGFCAAV